MTPCKHLDFESYDHFDWCKPCGALAFYAVGPGWSILPAPAHWEFCVVPTDQGAVIEKAGLKPRYKTVYDELWERKPNPIGK